MKNCPLVSIVIPVYNGADYMREAIDSALNQTYPNIEVLVINDGSRDDGKTDAIAREYGDRIRYIAKENGGVSTALNTGIREMKGEFFSWLSHDDVYAPEKVEIQMNDVLKLQAEGEDVRRIMFYCCGSLMNAEGKLISEGDKMYAAGRYSGNDALDMIFHGKVPGGCGFLIPREMFETVGMFREDMRYMQDVFMWERAFIAGYTMYVNKANMVRTRIHNQQTSVTGKEYGLKDREVVGRYLAEHLRGLRNSNGESLLEQYMLLCMRNNSLNIGNMIYKQLCERKELRAGKRIQAHLMKYYGMLRKKVSKVYYTVRYHSGR